MRYKVSTLVGPGAGTQRVLSEQEYDEFVREQQFTSEFAAVTGTYMTKKLEDGRQLHVRVEELRD